MGSINAEQFLIIICGLVILSYFFSIIGKYIRIPSVLLLLFAGVGFRIAADYYGIKFSFPDRVIEALGVIGLIMIVLEAGLDLRLGRSKLKIIRNSFFAALFIFAFSAGLIVLILFNWLHAPVDKCIIYAIPLSIMSSSIILPSLHLLSESKKEFLVYEASFSDIIGILAFNYFVANEAVSATSLGIFGINLLISILLSLILSLVLLFILAKTSLNIKFFLIFSLLVLIYTTGKILHLPSLLIILFFGMMMNNWDKIKLPFLRRFFPDSEVTDIRTFLHSITAESSFLIRTFFFILFGFSMQLSFLNDMGIIKIGLLIIAALLVVRILYLRFFLHTNLFPELFFIPRGLVTIVLFYKIPANMRLINFDDRILFFVILATSVIMALGMIFYNKSSSAIVEEDQFSNQ